MARAMRICMLATLAAGIAAGDQPATRAKPRGEFDAWLERQSDAAPATATAPASAPADAGRDPFAQALPREDALPGVMLLSDGALLAGTIFTTREQPLLVYVEERQCWRRVPLIAVLSITAEIVEERMELYWRWKGMGEPERVYTGQKYPYRRLLWKLHLIDGTELAGTIKGQPIWCESAGRHHGPYVLHERQQGEPGQELRDLLYVRKIILSRRLMQAVQAETGGAPGAGERP